MNGGILEDNEVEQLECLDMKEVVEWGAAKGSERVTFESEN